MGFISSKFFEKALKPYSILTAKYGVSKLFSKYARPSNSGPDKTLHSRTEQEFLALQALRLELTMALVPYPRNVRKCILYEMELSSGLVGDQSKKTSERLESIVDLSVFAAVLKNPEIVRMLSSAEASETALTLSFMRSVAMNARYFCVKERRAAEIARINNNASDESVLNLVERDQRERAFPSQKMFESFVKRAISGSLVAEEKQFSGLVQKLDVYSNERYLLERVLADSAAKNPNQARELIGLFLGMDIENLKEALKGADLLFEESLKEILNVPPGLSNLGEFVDKLTDATDRLGSGVAASEILSISDFHKKIDGMYNESKPENQE